jgi:MoxR-like ATPase
LLAGQNRRDMLAELPPQLRGDELQQLQAAVDGVHASDALLDYLQDVVAATRSGQWFATGLSPRASLALLRAAKAKALISGRDYVAPDDVQVIMPQCTAHRMTPLGQSGLSAVAQVRAMLATIALP